MLKSFTNISLNPPLLWTEVRIQALESAFAVIQSDTDLTPNPFPTRLSIINIFLNISRVLTHVSRTLIRSFFILNKNTVLARRVNDDLSSMLKVSVLKMLIEQGFEDCKERCG